MTERKLQLSPQTLLPLGAERLAGMIIDEAAANAGFRKRVKAALASLKGPDAVAKLIDKRLTALEQGRAVISWEKDKSFGEDLAATVTTIVKELAPLSPFGAVERLLRFVGGRDSVIDRLESGGGRVEQVYWEAAEALPSLIGRLPAVDIARAPGWLMDAIRSDRSGTIVAMARELPPLMTAPVLASWDELLERELGPNDEDRRGLIELRQAIADARGDLDAFIVLEDRRPKWRKDPLGVARRLLIAGRLPEALLWARKQNGRGIAFATARDLADGQIRHTHHGDRVALEVEILEAMRERTAAQALRWSHFEATFDVPMLREYIRKLDDFEEFEMLDKAFAAVFASQQAYAALDFFVEWPRLDLAAKHVLERAGTWDGCHYEVLGEAAAALETAFPAAATILYRALLDDILKRAKSAAYGHGARYLQKLDELAEDASADHRVSPHADYRLSVRAAHPRKAGFWALVKGGYR